jgi:cyclin H
MCDYNSSSQANNWVFTTETLTACRKQANQEARKFLSASRSLDLDNSPVLPFFTFACGFNERINNGEQRPTNVDVPECSSHGHPYLDPEEEATLVAFYAAKLPSLIGPFAQNPYLRREVKVTATAALLYRRFYLSNSVLLYDPKAIVVAAAFMATKVEDCLTQVHHLEEATKLMNAPVTQTEIIKAEYPFLGGINCDLLCFHPYKAVLAFTEDLRTFLKTSKGRELASFPNGEDRPIVGQDLSPMHNAARAIVDDAIVSDIPLLFSPGQIGLAALMVANDELNKPEVPKINLAGYIEHRFEGKDQIKTRDRLLKLRSMLKELKEGKHGCGNHMVDLQKLKAIHKKLKKCRSGEKKKKKRKGEEGDEDSEAKKARVD